MITDQIISIKDLPENSINESFLNNELFLINNSSLDFLKDEPDLYENY